MLHHILIRDLKLLCKKQYWDIQSTSSILGHAINLVLYCVFTFFHPVCDCFFYSTDCYQSFESLALDPKISLRLFQSLALDDYFLCQAAHLLPVREWPCLKMKQLKIRQAHCLPRCTTFLRARSFVRHSACYL